MKLTVIGFGQCGGRIADKFVKLNNRARWQRGLDIAPAVLAVNTDAADLSGLSNVPNDFNHRILIGGRLTGGHGIGKMNELAANIVKQDADRIFHAMRSSAHSFESEAFLLISSASGGTGSGSISAMTEILKDRYFGKPVYTLVVLPFEHEENSQDRAVYNTALCLKTVISVADAVVLVDNQRYVGKGLSMKENLDEINELIVEPFYDILCAGEERKKRYVGAKVLDAGDIMSTLTGWSVIGFGATPLSFFNFSFHHADFRNENSRTQRGVETLNRALSDLSLRCELSEAKRAFYLITGPSKELNTELDNEVGDYLRELMPQSIIRNGDYPNGKAQLGVHLMLSGLSDVEKVRQYYRRSVGLMSEFEQRNQASRTSLEDMEEVGKTLPYLL